MFNVVDAESGWKADLIIRKLRPFSDVEFSRRQPIDFFGVPIDVATLEDAIISSPPMCLAEYTAQGAHATRDPSFEREREASGSEPTTARAFSSEPELEL